MAKKLTTDFKNFKSSRVSFTEWDDNNDRSKGQKICYPKYNHPVLGENSPLCLQFPWTNIYKHGVPSLGEYYASDKDRAFLKLPLDLSDDNIKMVCDELVKLDSKILGMKDQLFGKKAKKYNYIPIVKNTDTDNDDDSPPWMKLKIKLSYPDEDVVTEVWSSELNPDDQNKKKRTRKQIDVNTVQEFQDNVSYLSNVRLIIAPIKLWAQSENLKEPNFGVTWRMEKVEVEPRSKSSNSLNQYKNNDAFIDTDDEENDVNVNVEANIEANVKKVNLKENSENSNDSDSDSEDESDEESEDEKPQSPILKKKKGKTKNT